MCDINVDYEAFPAAQAIMTLDNRGPSVRSIIQHHTAHCDEDMCDFVNSMDLVLWALSLAHSLLRGDVPKLKNSHAYIGKKEWNERMDMNIEVAMEMHMEIEADIKNGIPDEVLKAYDIIKHRMETPGRN